MSRIQIWIGIGALAGLIATTTLWSWSTSRYQAGWQQGRAALELEQRRAAEETRRRIRNADMGHGDPDDDLCWLALRVPVAPAGAGAGAPCP